MCTERNESLLESADGSMATVATRRENNNVSRSHNKIDLTPTGLLMEGVYTSLRFLFAKIGVNECNGDLSTAILLWR